MGSVEAKQKKPAPFKFKPFSENKSRSLLGGEKTLLLKIGMA